MNYRTADLSTSEVPEGVRISDRKITYISDNYINIGKESGYKKVYPKGKEYRAINKFSNNEYFGTARELGAILFGHLAKNSQVAAVNSLYHKKFKNSEGWVILDV